MTFSSLERQKTELVYSHTKPALFSGSKIFFWKNQAAGLLWMSAAMRMTSVGIILSLLLGFAWTMGITG